MMLNLVGEFMVEGFREIKSMNYILVKKGTEKEETRRMRRNCGTEEKYNGKSMSHDKNQL